MLFTEAIHNLDLSCVPLAVTPDELNLINPPTKSFLHKRPKVHEEEHPESLDSKPKSVPVNKMSPRVLCRVNTCNWPQKVEHIVTFRCKCLVKGAMHSLVHKQTFVRQLRWDSSLIFVKIGVSVNYRFLGLALFALFPHLGLLLFQVLSDSALHKFLLLRKLSEKESSRGLIDFLPFLNFLRHEKLDVPCCFLGEFSPVSVENLVFNWDTQT